MNVLFTFLLLLAQLPGPDSVTPTPVTVELKNGARIEGTLIEKDASFTVLKVSGGEVRIAARSILRVVDPKATAPRATEPNLVPSGRVRIDLGPPGRISFEVPEAWTETRIEGRERGFTDPTQSLFFGVSAVANEHSLWNLTAGIKKEYVKLYPGFALERERFGVLKRVRSWEIEFRYEKEGRPFREIQLLLDFGETKRIFTFTSQAARFDDLVARFRGVIESLRPEESTPEDTDEPLLDGAPGAVEIEQGSALPGEAMEPSGVEESSPGQPSLPSPSPAEESTEEEARLHLEQLLPPHLRSDP